MEHAAVSIPQAEIAALCRKYHIHRLALFGSVLRDDFHADSDIDVLVEFEPGTHIGWDIIALQDELSHLLGRKVDLNTPGFLSRHFREKVLESAQVIYERAG
jgi:uncharacterized protein